MKLFVGILKNLIGKKNLAQYTVFSYQILCILNRVVRKSLNIFTISILYKFSFYRKAQIHNACKEIRELSFTVTGTNHSSLALDVSPTLRTICKIENDRKLNSSRRRFIIINP